MSDGEAVVEEYFEQFFNDVGEGSPFEFILRGHLWVEYELLLSLQEAVPFPEVADFDRLTFPQKVRLIAAHGLVGADDIPAYNKLNALRNRLAHNLAAEITPQDEAELIGCMGERLRYSYNGIQDLDHDWPWPLRFAITAMCVQLQESRRQLRHANERLRTSAKRLVDLAGRSSPK